MDRAKICLIASDEAEPKVRLPVAKHRAVIASTIVDSDLNDVADEGKGSRVTTRLRAARVREIQREQRRRRAIT